MEVTPELLGAFPLLKPLPKEVLDGLAKCSSLRKFSRREIVLEAGHKELSTCFLFEGRLQAVDFTIDGREVGLYFVEPGGFCGELALFDTEPQTEFLIALTAAVVVFIPVKELRRVMLETPAITNVVGGKLASRIRQMTFQRSLLSLPNIGQRVCCQLWTLIPEQEKSEPGALIAGTNRNDQKSSRRAIVINNPPTHMEIAIMLNVSRETVTRVFQSLQNRQIVRRDGPMKLIVDRLDALKKFADGSEVL